MVRSLIALALCVTGFVSAARGRVQSSLLPADMGWSARTAPFLACPASLMLEVVLASKLATASLRDGTNFHRLDQPTFNGETVADVLIAKNGPGQVAHDLMHIDHNAPDPLGVKGNRLDMRVDLGPLLRPVGADLLRSSDEAAFEGFRPGHARAHGREGGVNVSRVEGCVRRT